MQQTLKDEIIIMKQDIKGIKERLDLMPTIEGMKLANKELVEEIFKETEKRYACKDVEMLVNKLMWLVISSVILAGLGIIFF